MSGKFIDVCDKTVALHMLHPPAAATAIRIFVDLRDGERIRPGVGRQRDGYGRHQSQHGPAPV